MSVNIDYAPVREQGNGAKLDFDFPFKIFNASDLIVSKILISTGVETLMVLNADYTVTIDTVTEGGTVTYTVAPTALQDSFIRREMDITQEADIPTNNLFREVQIENALDKGTMIDQQQQVQINRCLQVAETVTVDVLFPLADPGKAIMWNPTGDALINSTDNFNDIVTDAVAAQTAAELAESNAAASAAAAALSAAVAAADAVDTAADAVATAADALATAADAVDTAADAVATAADRVQTGLDRVQTGLDAIDTAADAVATAADRVQTGLDRVATAADRVQTGLDRVQTGLDRTQTGLDRIATAADVVTITNYIAGLSATSTTSLLIATGAKTFTTQASKSFAAGQFISAVSAANNANYMHGVVTSYAGTTLIINVLDIGGSGTLADWNINVSGSRGSIGATGPAGPGGTTFIGLTDVPASFATHSLKTVRVNVGETALEFYTPSSGSTLTRATFTNASLTAGVLTITHSAALSAPYTVLVMIFDNNGKQIIPDEVTGAANTVAVDLSSYVTAGGGSIAGTWGYGFIA